MSNDTRNGELLRAGRSPQTLGRPGVRRLNHIPLFICGAIALVVAVLIAWTAAERGKAVAVKSEDHGGNARDFAMAVAGDKTGYIPPAHVAPSATPPPPAVNAPEAVSAATPAPNEEAEARKKAFFQLGRSGKWVGTAQSIAGGPARSSRHLSGVHCFGSRDRPVASDKILRRHGRAGLLPGPAFQ